MSPPLPLPSKGALRALRSLAFGTSCAIGVIVEDRRRRISTLHTAVANKKKLKASRQYHQKGLGEVASQLDDDTVVGAHIRWHEREDHEPGGHREVETTDRTDSEDTAPRTNDSGDLFQEAHTPSPIPIPTQLLSLPPPPSQPTASQDFPFATVRRVPISKPNPSQRHLILQPTESNQSNISAMLQESHEALILSIEDLLANPTQESLGQGVSLFMSNSPAIPSSPLRDRWLEMSVRLSNECQTNSRWEEASQILTTVVRYGPMNEAQYFAYNPIPIIEFHLRRQDPDTPCSPESLNSACTLFLLKLEGRRPGYGAHMESVGRPLLLEAMSAHRGKLVQYIYFRLLGWVENTEAYVRWAIHTFFQYNDHKSVIKIFLLHYSHMRPPLEFFNETMDCVLGSFEALKGLRANSLLDALAQMEYPEGKLRTRWIMRVLRVHWARHEDMSKTLELFEHAVSVGLLEKVTHPQGIYLALVELAAHAGHQDVAYSFAKKVIRDHPDTRHDVALKLVVLKANAGDWDDVLQTFRQVRPKEMAEPAGYVPAFIVALQIFADSHSASETHDFAMQFIRETGSEFHPFMVTIVANKYGETRDMNGFIGWLELCGRKGFALDAGFCNSVLHNCLAKWEVSFKALQTMHSRLKAINPNCSDEVTQRILSQAAHRDGKAFKASRGVRPRSIAVSKLAYSGRSTDHREIYEAMNQELMSCKPAKALVIYKQAMSFGMFFSSHCFRLAVLAALRGKNSSSSARSALSMIQDAHAEGRDVGPAISTYIKHELDSFTGSPEDTVMHMRNLIYGLESSQIAVSPAVLTHMAEICVKIKHHEKAIILCHLARDRSGASHLCFSRQSFKALASAYAHLLDVQGMNSLIYHLSKSGFLADKVLLSHLKSIRRTIKKGDPSGPRSALLEAITRGIEQITQARAELHTEGKLISHEALRIVGDAVADLQKKDAEREPSKSLVPHVAIG
ncbi:hypothetical protein O1611_g6960 [Lasiodiplodia mahajangana]|uniref:Uncharacterized protein n=1 Tax=Lasiodiplodia mahajangana TaxID=1108764 RepID=A0ACC2JGN6_9PEZI|nr:hypothetical protein O1611_g6960 [Lasiodiplodia mahajangana]